MSRERKVKEQARERGRRIGETYSFEVDYGIVSAKDLEGRAVGHVDVLEVVVLIGCSINLDQQCYCFS